MASVTPLRRGSERRRNPLGEMTFMAHLSELRVRLVWALIAITIGSVIAWFLFDPILTFLIRPLKGLRESQQLFKGGRLIFTAPTEAFFVRMKVSAFTGFVIALPVVMWQLWRFITPGLHSKERKYALPFVFASMVLFTVGAAFALYSLPAAVKVLVAFAPSNALVLVPRAAEYLSFVLLLIAAFGITFELPLMVLALTLAGVVTTSTLRRFRKHVWVVIFCIAAFATPTTDPLTMTLMAIPLGLLFEATLLIARLLKK